MTMVRVVIASAFVIGARAMLRARVLTSQYAKREVDVYGLLASQSK